MVGANALHLALMLLHPETIQFGRKQQSKPEKTESERRGKCEEF